MEKVSWAVVIHIFRPHWRLNVQPKTKIYFDDSFQTMVVQPSFRYFHFDTNEMEAFSGGNDDIYRAMILIIITS